MTEGLTFGADQDKINDYRWAEYLALGLPQLDSEQLEAFAEWEKNYQEIGDLEIELALAKANLDEKEKLVASAVNPEQLTASTKAERKEQLDAIVSADGDVRQLRGEVGVCAISLSGVRVAAEIADKRLKRLNSQMAWRTQLLRLLSTLPKSPVRKEIPPEPERVPVVTL